MPLTTVRTLLQGEPHRGWDHIYAAKGSCGVSWYQKDHSCSLDWIDALAPDRTSALIDVGAGSSTLVDGLLGRGYSAITLLDQSEIALALTRERLQADPVLAKTSSCIEWLHADLFNAVLPCQGFDLWHDRAMFHFLTTEFQRRRYLQRVRCALRSGGSLIMVAFAQDGPDQCSGQPVMRYSLEDMLLTLGPEFDLIEHRFASHLTPSGQSQSFLHACLRYQPYA